jgi:hypothetical protein
MQDKTINHLCKISECAQLLAELAKDENVSVLVASEFIIHLAERRLTAMNNPNAVQRDNHHIKLNQL